MAKDRRKKTGADRVDLSKRVASQNGGRTGYAQPGGQRPQGNRRKKKKQSTGKVVLWSLLLVLILVIVFFVAQIVNVVVENLFPETDYVNDNIQTENYDTTPADHRDKVEYYLLGLLGEKNDSCMEMLSLACYDKEAGTVNFLEVPVDTYLGDGDTWDVRRVGYVWNNPRPLQWCDVCRRELKANEISGGKHNIESCGAAVTEKEGSAYRDLIRVFNEQYSLPVDHYFIMPQQALVKLIDLVQGVDISLGSYMVVGDTEYPTGVQTLDGAAALQYITDRSSGVSGDLSRIVRCRQVYAALLQRLMLLDDQQLLNTDPASVEEGVLGEVMNGSTPIRTDASEEEMVEILLSLKHVPLSSMTMYRMPGEAATLSGSTYYSVHKDELLKLLQQSFDPYGEEIYGQKIDAANLTLTEIANDETGDTKKQTMADVIEKQEGKITPPEETPEDTPEE